MTRARRRQLIHYHSMDLPAEDNDNKKNHGDILSLDATYSVDDHVVKKSSTEVSSSSEEVLGCVSSHTLDLLSSSLILNFNLKFFRGHLLKLH